jgi:hypothetical protein
MFYYRSLNGAIETIYVQGEEEHTIHSVLCTWQVIWLLLFSPKANSTCVVQQTSKAASLMAVELVLMSQDECLHVPPLYSTHKHFLPPPLCSLIGWYWCDHYVIRLHICFTKVPWEVIQLFLTGQGPNDCRRNTTFIFRGSDQALGVCYSKFRSHR